MILVKKQATWSFNPANILKKEIQISFAHTRCFLCNWVSHSGGWNRKQVYSALPRGRLHCLANSMEKLCSLIVILYTSRLLLRKSGTWQFSDDSSLEWRKGGLCFDAFRLILRLVEAHEYLLWPRILLSMNSVFNSTDCSLVGETLKSVVLKLLQLATPLFYWAIGCSSALWLLQDTWVVSFVRSQVWQWGCLTFITAPPSMPPHTACHWCAETQCQDAQIQWRIWCLYLYP